MSPRNTDMEQSALKLVFDAEDDGLLQSEMWKKLGVSSREGSRIALKFEKKGVIERRKILHDGRWTYRLYSKQHPVTLDTIKGCPCLSCEDIDKCVAGGSRSPINCSQLTEWIETNASKVDAGLGV